MQYSTVYYKAISIIIYIVRVIYLEQHDAQIELDLAEKQIQSAYLSSIIIIISANSPMT